MVFIFFFLFSNYLTDWFKPLNLQTASFPGYSLVNCFPFSLIGLSVQFLEEQGIYILLKTSHALEHRKFHILPEGRKWGLLKVVLRSIIRVVEDEKRKATRAFHSCQPFFTYKDQGERSIIVVITKYRQSDRQSTEWKVGNLVWL